MLLKNRTFEREGCNLCEEMKHNKNKDCTLNMIWKGIGTVDYINTIIIRDYLLLGFVLLSHFWPDIFLMEAKCPI